jgi:A/G-specific adenine glycosylase
MTDDRRKLARFRRALVAWYRRHARQLPWRMTHDPYRIWISEIMLQQTTVVAVVPYFERFLKRFPTLADLAASREQTVLRLWEGLGYYSRARNVHRTARVLVSDYGGAFPEDPAALLELPGIGRYTAGAIASFAFNRPVPIVETNTLRLYTRLMGLRDDPRSASGQKQLWEFAGQIVPHRNPGLFNQALMELGSRVCTPNAPDCPNCPVHTWCRAATNGWQTLIPVPTKRTEPTAVAEIAIAVRRAGKYLLVKRPAGERWAGLWDFIRFGVSEPDRMSPAKIVGAVLEQTGLQVALSETLAELRHSVTRFRITLCCHAAEWVSGEMQAERHMFRWVASTQFARFPLSVTGRRLARLVASRDASEVICEARASAARHTAAPGG